MKQTQLKIKWIYLLILAVYLILLNPFLEITSLILKDFSISWNTIR